MMLCASTGSRLATGSSARIISRILHHRPGHADALLLAAAQLVGADLWALSAMPTRSSYVHGLVDIALRETG